ATYNTIPWHQSGAAARGGSGTSPAEYYPTATFDVAATVDATVTIPGIDQRIEFSGATVTDAFRFWFTNPGKNFGYSIELAGPSLLASEFSSSEDDDGRRGPVLSITFAIAPTAGADCNHNGVSDDCEILAGTALDVNHNGVPDECECIGDLTGDN